jgi:hypothetical protein
LFGFTILTTWMYNRNNGNLLLPALLHPSVNVTAKYLFNSLFAGADLIHLWWLWSGFWPVVAAIILTMNGSNLAKPASAE